MLLCSIVHTFLQAINSQIMRNQGEIGFRNKVKGWAHNSLPLPLPPQLATHYWMRSRVRPGLLVCLLCF